MEGGGNGDVGHVRLRAELEVARQAVGSDVGCIYTASADGERMLCQAATSVAPQAPLSFGLKTVDCGAMRAALASGDALMVEDTLSDARVATVAKSRFGLRACLYAPFESSARRGVAVFSQRQRHVWSEAQGQAAVGAASTFASLLPTSSHDPQRWSETLWRGYPGWCGVMRDGLLLDGWWSDRLGDGITLADLFGEPGEPHLQQQADRVGRGEVDHATVRVRCRARSYRVQFGAVGDGDVGLFIQPWDEEAPSSTDGELRELAAQLGHELNNALQYLANVLDAPAEITAAAREVVARGGRLTDQLLAYTGSAKRRSQSLRVVGAPGIGDVLIVEDDRNVARSLSRVLRRKGAEVRLTGTVAEGIEEVRQQRPDALLLDMILPDGTGHDLLVELASELRGVQVIVMTGYAEADALRRVRGLGLPVLAKPFDPTEVISRLGLED